MANKVTEAAVNKPVRSKFPLCIIILLFLFCCCPLFITTYILVAGYFGNTADLNLVQAEMSEAFAYKIFGDETLGGKGPEGMTVELVSIAEQSIRDELQRFNVPQNLSDYKQVNLDWINEVIAAEGDIASWNKVGETPAAFSIRFDDNSLKSEFESSLQKIVMLKVYGDLAIAKGDRDSMHFIAAKLLVQRHWMENLGQSDSASLPFDSSFKVEATAGLTAKRNPCIKELCLQDAPRLVSGVYRSARNYAVGDSNGADWQTTWAQSPSLITAGGGTNLEGMGVVSTGDGNFEIPPLSEFANECQGKGGVVNGSGGVKTRLPVSANGDTCWYGNGCWDFLTYAGGRYMGGNLGCEEEGLVPAPGIVDGITDFVKGIFVPDDGFLPEVNNFDGRYALTITSTQCDIPYFDAATLAPFESQFEVRGNNIIYPEKAVSIDSSGRATTSFSYSASGVYVDYNDELLFAKSGNGVTVSGSFYLTGNASGQGVSLDISCSGEYSGQKL